MARPLVLCQIQSGFPPQLHPVPPNAVQASEQSGDLTVGLHSILADALPVYRLCFPGTDASSFETPSAPPEQQKL